MSTRDVSIATRKQLENLVTIKYRKCILYPWLFPDRGGSHYSLEDRF